ncbi:hypothetical protein EX30DRAFT_88653 [Ascodesmis nigricans]|uniref:Uncharacterized protein n=1 Tax=Ascodesmis nigricans TaxID=341454 RepID=A0A4S2N3B9_9PEZI|nr:hypothetical protein EX30DRAFT_88653 [Ascodesmis nigricans]
MFSRLINAIDSQIAQEQSKSYQSSRPSAGNNTRSASRLRPDPRASSNKTGSTTTAGAGAKEKDPAEFESDLDTSAPASSIGTPTRGGTPAPSEAVTDDPLGALKEKDNDDNEKDKEKDKDSKGEGDEKPAATNTAPEKPAGTTSRARTGSLSTAALAQDPNLPAEVRQKLRKLDKIEGRYNGMFPKILYSAIY